jgi:hypothetical protein
MSFARNRRDPVAIVAHPADLVILLLDMAEEAQISREFVPRPPVGIARVAARSRTGEVRAQVMDLRRHGQVAGRAQGFGAMVIHVARLARRRPQQVARAVTLAAAEVLVDFVLEGQRAHQCAFPHSQFHARRYGSKRGVVSGLVARRTGKIARGIVMAGRA